MNANHFKLALLLGFLSAFLSSCQIQESLQPDAPAFQAAEPVDCDEDEPRWFNLTPIDPLGADYAYDLVTSATPYTLHDCLCDVQRYEIEFAWLPSSEFISVYDQNNQEIDFYTNYDPATGEHTMVILAGSLADGATSIYIDFSGANCPPVRRAGGLCIVDNLGGIFVLDPPTLRYAPYWHYQYPQGMSSVVRNILIPTAMTEQI